MVATVLSVVHWKEHSLCVVRAGSWNVAVRGRPPLRGLQTLGVRPALSCPDGESLARVCFEGPWRAPLGFAAEHFPPLNDAQACL